MRSSVRSRLAPPRFAFGYAWRSHAGKSRSVPGEARKSEDGLLVSPVTKSSSAKKHFRIRYLSPESDMRDF
jgi:hypothetical protein